MAPAYSVGFRSLNREVTALDLDVEGDLPGWLDGSLIRNGPGSFDVGDGRVDHWFDGLAMLTKFAFEGGRVTYTNRFLRTDAYEQAARGEFDGGFATGTSTLRQRLGRFLFGDTYDNTNVIAERVGDRYVALTETPRWVEFDPATLETLGDLEYDGPAPSGQLSCAHLNRDPRTDEVVNVEVEFGLTNRYHVYSMTDPDERSPIASIPVDEVAYMHSFALTPRYVVLTEFPFVVDPISFLKPGRQPPFIEHFEWRPERGTRFIVVGRDSGEVVAEPRTGATFGFHHVNAYEDGDELVIDLECVPGPEPVEALYMDDLDEGLDVPAAAIHRFRVDPAAPSIDRREVYGGGTALPTVSPETWLDEHRYVYAQGTEDHVTEWPGSLVKIDAETGTATEFTRPESHFSEPIFVPRPGGDGEDAGVVLSIRLDREAERSSLVVLDGEDFEERARAPLPHVVPFDFHGRFFASIH